MVMPLDAYRKHVSSENLQLQWPGFVSRYHYIYGSMLCDKDCIFMHEQAQCNSLKTMIISCDSGHLALPSRCFSATLSNVFRKQ